MTAARLSQTGLAGRSTRTPALSWARIGDVAGAALDITYTDTDGVTWRCVQWNTSHTSGLVIAVAGLADSLLVSGGGGGINAALTGTGAWNHGLLRLPAGQLAIVVGAAGRANNGDNNNGGPSSVGAFQSVHGGGYAGDRCNGPFVSSITGSSVSYCAPGSASPRPNFGDGGTAAAGGVVGSTGTVIIRTPV